MSTSRNRWAAVLLSSGILMAAAFAPADKGPAGMAPSPRWWKGNTHTHTYWSDGNAAPEHVIDWYVRHGYHFLVLSDHNILSEGEAWFPISTEGGRPLRPVEVDDLERRFGPGWVAIREADGSWIWDIALTLRLTRLRLGLLYGLATDDAHHHHARNPTAVPGRGWVWVRADELTPDCIVTAMRNGEFYASTGVILRDFGVTDGALWLEIETEPGLEYTTEFIGTRVRDGEPIEIGEVLATSTASRPEYRPMDDVLYVRARVTSSRPHPDPFLDGDMETAWVQPITGPAALAP